MKLLYVGNMPSPYQMELFKKISDSSLAEVKVLFCMWSYPGRGWQRPELPENFEVLPSISLQWLLPDLVLSFNIERKIRLFLPDVAIVGSYMVPGLHQAMRVLTALRIPWLYWDEIHALSGNPLKRSIRKYLRNKVLRECSGVLAIGKRAKVFFEELVDGARPVYNFPYSSNLTRFFQISRKPSDGAIRFLFSGQLIHRKGVDILIEAFKKVAPHFEHTSLTILGDGPLRRELEARVPPEIRDRVTFEGMVQWESLPRYYSNADVFVFPSRHDGWGIVVPEAMASGLPVVSTKEVTAALDLVHENQSGFLFQKDDEDALVSHMTYFCENPHEICRMSQAAREIVKTVDIDYAGTRLVETLRQLTTNNLPA